MMLEPSTGLTAPTLVLIVGVFVLPQSTCIREAKAQTTNLISISRFAQAQSKTENNADQSFAEAEQLRNIGTPESLHRALEKYVEVLRFRRAGGNRAGEALALNRIGLVHLRLSDAEKALVSLQLALPILREIGDARGQAETLTNMGGAYYLLNKREDAVESFQQASFLWQALDDQSGLAQTLRNLGAVYYKLNKFDQALNYATQARVLSKLIGDKQGEAETLTVIEKIFTQFKQDLAKARAQNDPGVQASLAGRICMAYSVSGERERSIACYKSILGFYRSIGFSNATLERIGIEYLWLGDYQSSLDYFEQSAKAPGSSSVKNEQYLNKGYLYQTLGDFNKALATYQEGLSQSPRVSNRLGQAYLLAGIGLAELSLHRDQSALDHFLNAKLAIDAQKKESQRSEGILFAAQRVEGITMGGLGLVYKALGDRQKALDSFNQGLFLLRRYGERIFESAILLNMGLMHYEAGDKEKAATYYRQARVVSQLGRDLRGEAAALYGMARIEAESQNLSISKRLIEAAIGIIEALRAKTPGQELRSSFFSSVQDYYELYIYILMQMHKQTPSESLNFIALQASERARARALLESLGETQSALRKRVDQKLLDREQELQQKLSAKAEEQLRSITSTNQNQDYAALETDIANLTNALQDIRTEIRIKNPKLASLVQPQPSTVTDIQQILDSDTLLLEYKLGDKGSYLWLLSSDSIASFELASRAEIEPTAKHFYETITEPNRIYRATEYDRGLRVRKLGAHKTETEDAASALSQMLLGQLTGKLGKKRLIVVADGVLQYVPFAALLEPRVDAQGKSQPLVVGHEIVSLPSASTISAIRKEPGARKAFAKTVAMLADPVFDQSDDRVKAAQGQKPNAQPVSPEVRALIVKAQGSAKESGLDNPEFTIPRLPATRREAERILALVPSENQLKALDFAASRMVAMSSDLSNYRIVHFATHGLVNSSNPDLSGILLSMVDEQGKPQNGFLQAHEVYKMNLPADLVVLSACQTALGKEIRGEGLVGLTRGFMYAGTASVVASLWQVNDEATADLMVKFYSLMLKDGLKPAAALRAAQLDVSREGKWDSPYYWAAFILQGEWR